jgi:hypothetical protein
MLFATLLMLTLQSTGRVEITLRDVNTREAVPGVLITLTSRVPNEPAGLSTTLVTDPRGLATFAALSAGPYAIRIGEGFQAAPSSEYIVVDPGNPKRMEIFVKPIASLTGRVVYPNDAPSVAAVITLLSPAYENGRQVLRASARSTIDHEGKFRFTGVSSGEFYLRIENQEPWSIAYYPGVADLSGAQKLTIHGQELRLGDIRLPNQTRFQVSGSVIQSPSDNSRGLGALTVYLAHDSPIFQEEPFVVSASSVRIGPTEVRFELHDIPAGSYVLYPVLGERSIGSLGRGNLRVEDGDVRDLKIAIKPMVGIRGRIVMKDSQSKLPENMRIATPSRDVYPPLLISDLSRGAIAVSRSGEFAVRNLVDGGRYDISVQGLPPDAYVSDIRLGTLSILSDSSFVAGPTEESFEVQIAIPGGILRGIVRDATEQPAATASVVVVPDFARRKNSAFFKRATTDSRGQFAIQGLAPGEYYLFAWPAPPPQGAEEDPAFLGPFESRSTRVKVTPGVTVDTTVRLMN